MFISYDIAWTPDNIIQRAGRILRFWITPRKVSLVVFVGQLREDIERQRASQRVEERLRRLTARTRKAEKFSELPIMPDEDVREYITLGDLSSIMIEDLGLADITQVEEFTGVSPFSRHITELSQNISRAKNLPDDLSSALDFAERRPYLYLLLRYKRKYSWALYDIQERELRKIHEDRLLDMIQCTAETPVAEVDPNEIEVQAQVCKMAWAKAERIEDPASIERICALYLKPVTDRTGMAQCLRRPFSPNR
jgi:hypothetical protein